jgi:2'-5' RNA ligase
MPHRTFIALELDEPVRRNLAEIRRALPRDLGKINWVAPENLHVTMKFLGELDAPGLTGACEAADVAAGRVEPFRFAVTSLRCLPPRGGVRMIWAEPDDPQARIAGAFGALEAALTERGFPPDARPFAAHITLARVRFTRQASTIRRAVAHQPGPFGEVSATHLTVFTSELTPHGPIHTPARRVQFGT